MIVDDVIALLVADTTLTDLLGGPNVFPGHKQDGQDLPCVNVDHGGETGELEVGYRTSPKRDHGMTLSVDVWTRQGVQHRAEICERLDEILMPGPIAGTWPSWSKVSDSRPWDESLRAYHATMRYAVNYTLSDS